MNLPEFKQLFQKKPLLLAPMEEVTDAAFRQLCRSLGATITYTEFVAAEGLLRNDIVAKRRRLLTPKDNATGVQIYGSNAEYLAIAAERVLEEGAPFIDINCGCWVPRVVAKGAGAAWLKDPNAMVAMAKMIVSRVHCPVTVKTRIGWGLETTMPIVELAKALEGVGVSAITVHCRTARQGYEGEADWRWAERVQKAVGIPVVVNGDIRTAGDARRALELTECAGAMIGRRAIEHPWIFREGRALLDTGVGKPKPTLLERTQLALEHFQLCCEYLEPRLVQRSFRRFVPYYLRGIAQAEELVARFTEENDIAVLESELRSVVAAVNAEQCARR